MSEFDTTKNGVIGRLVAKGFSESKEPFNFDNAAATEYDKKFILKIGPGNLDNESSQMIIDRVYDFQTWQIQIAFSKSAHNDIINRDDMHRKKDEIIKDIDNPDNWRSFSRVLKYRAWDTEETDNYFLLIIDIEIQVKYLY